MAVYKRGHVWWYRFTWNGTAIRESTKQTNKRVAEQIEAAHKTSLAKGEVGIRERKPVPTLAEFAETDFLPYVRTRFADKPKTLAYYEVQTGHLVSYPALANAPVDAVPPAVISGFVAKWRAAEYEVSSTNRALQVLRRMLRLAVEWGKAERPAPRVSLLPGERQRERVLNPNEEAAYLKAAQAIGESILEAYQRRLRVFGQPRGETAPPNRKIPFSCGTYRPFCSIVASGQRSVTGLDGSTAGTARCLSRSARLETRAGRFRCRSGSMRFLRCGEPSRLRNGPSPHPPRADTSNHPPSRSATARRVRSPDLNIFRSTPSGTLASPDGRITWTHTRWRTLRDTAALSLPGAMFTRTWTRDARRWSAPSAHKRHRVGTKMGTVTKRRRARLSLNLP